MTAKHSLAALVLFASLLAPRAVAGVESKSYAVNVTFDTQVNFEDCFVFDDEDGFCSAESLLGTYTQNDFGFLGLWTIETSLKVEAVGIHIFGVVVFGIGTSEGAVFTLQGNLTLPCECSVGAADSLSAWCTTPVVDGNGARRLPVPAQSVPNGTGWLRRLVARTRPQPGLALRRDRALHLPRPR